MPARALAHSLRSYTRALAFLLVHQFFQTPAVASVWIDAHPLTHSLRSRASGCALLFVHRFYQTPAVASVWTDARDSFVFAAFFSQNREGHPRFREDLASETLLSQA